MLRAAGLVGRKILRESDVMSACSQILTLEEAAFEDCQILNAHDRTVPWKAWYSVLTEPSKETASTVRRIADASSYMGQHVELSLFTCGKSPDLDLKPTRGSELRRAHLLIVAPFRVQGVDGD